MMRKLFNLQAVLLLAVSLIGKAQSHFDLEMEQEVKAGKLYVSYFIKKTSGPDFMLGSSNFIAILDTTNLYFSQKAKVDSMDGIWDNNANSPSYKNILFGGRVFVNMTVFRNTDGNGAGVPVTSNRQRVAGFSVPIKDPCGTTTIVWKTVGGAFTDFSVNNITAYANFINPSPNFPLCSMPEAPMLQASGPLSFCEGNNLTLSAGASVNWYRDSVMIGSGAQISVNQSGWYHAVAANCICEAPSQAVYVEVTPLPIKPTITANGTGLSSSNAANYQWYLNGQVLPGDTNQHMVPSASGNYTVSSSNECGISVSDPYNLQISGIDEVVSENGFAVYPNPYKGATTVYYTLLEPSDLVIEVFSTKGDKVATLVNERGHPAGKHQKNFSAEDFGYAAGTYLLKFIRNGGTQTVKLIEIQ